MYTETSPSFRSVNFESICAVSLTPEFASPSVTTSAMSGRAGSRGRVRTERIVPNTSVRPWAERLASHLSAAANDSLSHSCQRRNAYE